MGIKVYPWTDVIWDIAADRYGLDLTFSQYNDLADIERYYPSGLDVALFKAILSGEITPLNELGTPLPAASAEELIGTAHVTPEGVNNWFRSRGIGHQWAPPENPPHKRKAFLRQEEAILGALKRLGHEAVELPVHQQFQSGSIKQKTRELVRKREPELFTSEGVFNKAWERLRGFGLIKDRSP